MTDECGGREGAQPPLWVGSCDFKGSRAHCTWASEMNIFPVTRVAFSQPCPCFPSSFFPDIHFLVKGVNSVLKKERKKKEEIGSGVGRKADYRKAAWKNLGVWELFCVLTVVMSTWLLIFIKPHRKLCPQRDICCLQSIKHIYKKFQTRHSPL